MPPAGLGATQVHWSRLRRSGLVKPFKGPVDAAHGLLGIQAQLMAAANIAFWNRVSGCTLERLAAARFEERSLVRFWGQRNTVHMYAAEDWPFLHTALAERRSILHRRLEKAGLLGEFRRVVKRTEKKLAGNVLTYADVRASKLQELSDKWVVSYVVFMELVRDGLACHGPDQRNASGFVHRLDWLPDLDWSPPDAADAQRELALRYLAAYGPAEATDLAFWYGTTLTNARRWIASAGDECREAGFDGRSYWYRTSDTRTLRVKPPARSRWPVRLLYRFDPLLLATKDKSWLIDEAHYKRVWRSAAHVEPVLLVAGRIAGTWRYDRKGKGLEVTVRPFARLNATVTRAVEIQVAGLAGFLGLPLRELWIED